MSAVKLLPLVNEKAGPGSLPGTIPGGRIAAVVDKVGNRAIDRIEWRVSYHRLTIAGEQSCAATRATLLAVVLIMLMVPVASAVGGAWRPQHRQRSPELRSSVPERLCPRLSRS